MTAMGVGELGIDAFQDRHSEAWHSIGGVCKSVPELPPGSGSASTKITEDVIVYRYHLLNEEGTWLWKRPREGRQRLEFKSSSLPAAGKASMREHACSTRVERTAG
jgi:hypothetical protein